MIDVPCRCKIYCGDTPEQDDVVETCRDLPLPPPLPLVEIVLVRRGVPDDPS